MICYNGQGTIVSQGILTSILFLHRNGGGAHEEKQIEF